MLKVETEGATAEAHTAGDRQVCRQTFRGKYIYFSSLSIHIYRKKQPMPEPIRELMYTTEVDRSLSVTG